MKRVIIFTAFALLCAANAADAKSLDRSKYTNQDLAKEAKCLLEIDKAAQSAKDGNPKPHDHSKCEEWEDIVRQKEPNPPPN